MGTPKMRGPSPVKWNVPPSSPAEPRVEHAVAPRAAAQRYRRRRVRRAVRVRVLGVEGEGEVELTVPHAAIAAEMKWRRPAAPGAVLGVGGGWGPPVAAHARASAH